MHTVRLMLATSATWALAAPAPALAQEMTAQNSGSQQGAAQTSTSEGATEDVVVTAQKRVQTLLEVPQSVSVISGETLERQQARSFLDFAQLVPGLNVTQTFPGQSRLILRGINTGSVGSTVAVYVDDVPYGQSGSLANGGILAGDFDTFDIARVEVLRGPQGTLYGANSLGGVLKYVTTAPKLGKFEGTGQAGIETTASGGTGYFGNLVLNAPLGDMLAVRASGYYKKTAGYLEPVGRAGTNVDSSRSYGGRASLLFQPSSNFSVRLVGLAQDIRVDSPSSFQANPLSLRPVDPITGLSTGDDMQRYRYERYNEFHNIDYRLYSGTIDWNLGFADLTSVTSWSTQKERQVSDLSTNSARGTAGVVYAGVAGVPSTSVGLAFRNDVSVYKLTQEARLVSPKSRVFEWLVGTYYTHETTSLDQEYLPFVFGSQALIPQALTGSPFGTFQKFVIANINAHYEEIAGFANGTLHLGPRFDITGGVRYSHNRQDSAQAVIQLGGGTPIFGGSSQGVFTWSVSPRFQLSDRTAVYARVAKGYRPGGPNFIPAGAPSSFPSQFGADTLISYEAGIKAETPDRKFGIDLSGFYIDWDNILINSSVVVNGTTVGINGNGQKARSYGAEGTVTLRPTQGLSVIGTVAYTKAYLRGDTIAPGGLNLTGAFDGDQLPFAPRWSANLSADYDWALSGATRAFIGGNVHLQSDQPAGFSAAYRAAFGHQIRLDGYATMDLRAGLEFGNITVSAYARNVTNEYGLINAAGYPFAVPAAIGGAAVPLISASTIRPRTVGGSVGFKF